MQESAVEAALELLRPGLGSDGFELRLGSIDPDGSVQVILEARPDACLDCLVPEDMMVRILENAIRQKDASLDHVTIVRSGFDQVTAAGTRPETS